MSRLFVDQDISVGHEVRLDGQACHYLRNVLRLRKGDSVVLFNGLGGEFSTQIVGLERDRAILDVTGHNPVERESSLKTELGLAVIKRDAMDNAVRKATELGVTTIIPLLTDYTTVSRKQAFDRHDHWVQVTRSACEQCGRNRPPHMPGLTNLNDWLEKGSATLKLMADPGAPAGLDQFDEQPASIMLLSGPEGGFSEAELAHVRTSGFEAVSLGPRILRADTAPLAMLSLVQHRWGDL